MSIKAPAFLAAGLLLAGCASTQGPGDLEDIDTEVNKSQASAPEARPRQRKPGSLWGASQQQVFADNKASQVGDIITVNLTESTQGSNTASTQASRESSNSAGVSGFFGQEDEIPGDDPTAAVGTNTANELDGEGETSRAASLTGNMTAVVTRVFPNGNMRIKGRREVTINNEQQNMLLAGIIRPQDIGPENSIRSSQIANARIRYVGDGVVARQQDEGWMTKILHYVWPF